MAGLTGFSHVPASLVVGLFTENAQILDMGTIYTKSTKLKSNEISQQTKTDNNKLEVVKGKRESSVVQHAISKELLSKFLDIMPQTVFTYLFNRGVSTYSDFKQLGILAQVSKGFFQAIQVYIQNLSVKYIIKEKDGPIAFDEVCFVLGLSVFFMLKGLQGDMKVACLDELKQRIYQQLAGKGLSLLHLIVVDEEEAISISKVTQASKKVGSDSIFDDLNRLAQFSKEGDELVKSILTNYLSLFIVRKKDSAISFKDAAFISPFPLRFMLRCLNGSDKTAYAKQSLDRSINKIISEIGRYDETVASQYFNKDVLAINWILQEDYLKEDESLIKPTLNRFLESRTICNLGLVSVLGDPLYLDYRRLFKKCLSKEDKKFVVEFAIEILFKNIQCDLAFSDSLFLHIQCMMYDFVQAGNFKLIRNIVKKCVGFIKEDLGYNFLLPCSNEFNGMVRIMRAFALAGALKGIDRKTLDSIAGKVLECFFFLMNDKSDDVYSIFHSAMMVGAFIEKGLIENVANVNLENALNNNHWEIRLGVMYLLLLLKQSISTIKVDIGIIFEGLRGRKRFTQSEKENISHALTMIKSSQPEEVKQKCDEMLTYV